MYLTDYRERSLKDVITQLEPALFKKVTGLSVKDFELLVGLGVFNSGLMNDAAGKTFHPDFRTFAQVWRRSGRGSSGVDSRSEGLCGAVLGSRLRWVDAAVLSSELF